MLAPLSDVFLVMGAEVLTILGTEMVFRPRLFVVVSIIGAPFLIFRSAAIIFPPVLRVRCAREDRQSGSQDDSKYVFLCLDVHIHPDLMGISLAHVGDIT